MRLDGDEQKQCGVEGAKLKHCIGYRKNLRKFHVAVTGMKIDDDMLDQ